MSDWQSYRTLAADGAGVRGPWDLMPFSRTFKGGRLKYQVRSENY